MLNQLQQQAGPSNTPLVSECAVIIPTFNAHAHWPALHQGLLKQGLRIDQILVVDSSSSDDTPDLVRQAGIRLVTIAKSSFRHGHTRQMAACLVPEAKYLVYLTQDAIPFDESALPELLSSFKDASVGGAYGRQLPRPQADAIERHARLFNYPEIAATRSFESRLTLGFRCAYFSNSFAAYRRTAFDQVGGFPEHAIVSEDVEVAARMLMNGWRIAYQPSARVIHSHHFSLRAEFSRYFDISVHHRQESWIKEHFGSVGGEGFKFVRSELRYLLAHAPQLIPLALLRSAAKWTAYRGGQYEHLLPLWLKQKLSKQASHWSEHSLQADNDSCNHAKKTSSRDVFYPIKRDRV